MKRILLVVLCCMLVLAGCKVADVDEMATGDVLEHNITSEGYSETVKDSQGRECYIIRGDYPVIENSDNNSFIDYVNEVYENRAKEFYDAGLKNAEAAVLLAESDEEPPATLPWEEESFFKVVRDKGGYISIAESTYHQLGGAHPVAYQFAKTFDMKNEKELEISDVLKGSNEEINKLIYDAFIEKYGEEYFYLGEDEIKTAIDTIDWYITDEALVLYFNVYEVTPYVAGMPTVEIMYQDNTDIFRISLE